MDEQANIDTTGTSDIPANSDNMVNEGAVNKPSGNFQETQNNVSTPAQTTAPVADNIPESYSFEAPPHYSAADKEAVTNISKELGLTSNEQAQKLIGVAERMQDASVTAHNNQVEAWDKDLRNDKDFGGANFDNNVQYSVAGLNHFDKDGVIGKMLQETGYGNNPDVVKFFNRIGKELGDDKLLSGSIGNHPAKALEDQLFVNTPKYEG